MGSNLRFPEWVGCVCGTYSVADTSNDATSA